MRTRMAQSQKRPTSRSKASAPRKSVANGQTGAKLFKPVTERGRRSNELLLQAAEEVFGELGYHEASVAEIVRKAGVAQGTFYIHFKGKREIFAELLRRINQHIRARSSEASTGAKTFIEAERLGFEAFFRFVIERPKIYRLIWEAEFVDPGLRREYQTKIVGNWAKRLATMLNEKGARELDVEAISWCLFGIAAFAALRWPYWTGARIPDKSFKSILLFMEYGIGPYLREAGESMSKSK